MRGSFLPCSQQMTKTKGLVFPWGAVRRRRSAPRTTTQLNLIKFRFGFESLQMGQLALDDFVSSLQGLNRTPAGYDTLYLAQISMNRVFFFFLWGTINFILKKKKREREEAQVWRFCGSIRPTRSLCIHGVCHGKISETNKLPGLHPSAQKTLLKAVDCALRVWCSSEGTSCLSPLRLKMRKELFSLQNGRQINKYSWADNEGRRVCCCELKVV